MVENSKIEWTDHTFNPWLGCSKVSAGCTHCYAETLMAKRWGKVQWGKGKERKRTSASYWRQPLKWDREAAVAGVRRKVFCASLADVFDEEVPDTWRSDLFYLIEATPNLDWLLLTKRPEKMRAWITDQWPLKNRPFKTISNIWLGVSVEDQATADERIPLLLETPATVRFVSYEPALAPVDFKQYAFDREKGIAHLMYGPMACNRDQAESMTRNAIDWVICGGESGQGARPFDVAWARSTIRQCRAAGVACFVKQLGSNPAPLRVEAGSVLERLWLKDSKGGNIQEWPEDLRVREFPIAHVEYRKPEERS